MYLPVHQNACVACKGASVAQKSRARGPLGTRGSAVRLLQRAQGGQHVGCRARRVTHTERASLVLQTDVAPGQP